jgi:hypothetical protein
VFEPTAFMDADGSADLSPFERALTALLDRPAELAVDAFHPAAGVAWEWAGGDLQEPPVADGSGKRGEAEAAGGAKTAADAEAGDAEAADPGAPEFSELRRLLDAGLDPLARAAAASRQIAKLSAEVATSLAEFARCRPAAEFDRQPGEQGAMSAATRAARPAALWEVSEWAVDEVAPTLRISSTAAGAQLVESLVLVERLPATLALLADGELSPAHARQMINIVGPVEDDEVRAAIEAHVLGLLGRKSPPQLGDCARRVVLRMDADAAARRLVAAVRERGVRLHDRRDGTGTVAVDLPLPAAAAIYRALEAYAEQARVDGDERTKQQRMADCVQDLILRTDEHGMPPVTIALTLVATLETMLGGAEPGQVDGMLVPAEMVRELAYTFGLLPRPAPDVDGLPDGGASAAENGTAADDEAAAEASRQPAPSRPMAGPSAAEPVPGRPESAASASHSPPEQPPEPEAPPETRPETEPAPGPVPEPTPAKDRALSEWLALAKARQEAAVREGLTGDKQAILDGTWTDGELRGLLDVGALMGVRELAGTGLAHRPRIAIVDKLRGSLVALTDAAGVRRGVELGPPPETDGYTPGAELDRFVRLRDRRCRFPGCRRRARACDLDHRREWPAGSTSHENLCCLCEHHHRLKHQAPGWRFDEADDGGVAITMPSGEVLVSHPPRFGTDLDIPPF